MKSTLPEMSQIAQASADLPPYLTRTEVMELDDLPLQVSLLTMEVAAQRQALERLAAILGMAARMARPAPASLDDG
jgi:hypothetical protein